MKILFDTSVLAAAIVEPHPMHPDAFPWLKRAKSGEFDMFVASHTLAELYAVLTTLPVSPGIPPDAARRLIHDDVETTAKIISLSSQDYISTIRNLADLGLSGGIIYDALIVRAAKKSGADKVLTFNVDDFSSVWPEGKSHLVAP
ncbi:MAG: PIN domain-containing protein [Nitrospirota bacterium]